MTGTIPTTAERPCYRPGITDDTYHGDRSAVSSSTLRTLIQRSPAHARADLDTPRTETPALLLGRAVHARVLEPETYAGRYVVAPVCDRRTKEGKATWAEHLEAHPHATTITAADAEIVEGIAAAIEAHPIARHAVRGGVAELSGWYVDAETGVHCRIRPDYLRAADGILVDLKTTLDASRAAFGRSIAAYGYHIQAGLYADGHHRITGEHLRDVLFVIAEKSPPYAVGVYRIDEDALLIGRRLYLDALLIWASCLESGRWPAYAESIESISLPAWAMTSLIPEESIHA